MILGKLGGTKLLLGGTLALGCAPPGEVVAREPFALQARTDDQETDLQEIEAEVLRRAREIAAIQPTQHLPRPRTVDIKHYHLDIAVDLDQHKVQGDVTVRFRALSEPVSRLHLDAADMEIHKVQNAAGVELSHEILGDALSISLARPVGMTESTEIRISYSATPSEGLFFLDANSQGGVPQMAFTQGQCSMTRAWFPCSDRPDERATQDLEVTIPDSLVSISNGVLLETRSDEPNLRTDLWQMTTPFPVYLTTLVIGDLQRVDLGSVGETPLEAWVRPGLETRAAVSLQTTGEIFEELLTLAGSDYPYPIYRQVMVPVFPYGGMENVTSTTLQEERLYPVEQQAEKQLDMESLIAHELAHQWWGDLITCATWSDAWLNEGFASYLDLMTTERRRGRDEFLASLLDVQQSCVEARTDSGRSVVSNSYVHPDELFDAHIYEGGSTFLHLLRSQLGEEDFLAAVRETTTRCAGSSITTAEFESVFQEAAGRDLGPLFEEWLHQPGLPSFELNWRYSEEDQLLTLVAKQIQQGDGVPRVFHGELPVVVYGDFGKKELSLELSRRTSRLKVECETEPFFVRFNRGSAFTGTFSVTQPLPAWSAQVVLDDDPAGRVEAAAALATWKPRSSAKDAGSGLEDTTEDELRQRRDQHYARVMLARSLLGDPFFKVRAVAARSLGQIGGDNARTALSAGIWDPDPRVRLAVVEALGEFDGDFQAAAFLMKRWEFETTALVRGAILGALANIGPEQSRVLLVAVADNPDEPFEIRGAALEALATADPPAALERALSLSSRDHPAALRKLAVATLGLLCAEHPSAAHALCQLLDEPPVTVKLWAARAITAAEDPALLPVLVEHYERAPIPDIRAELRGLIKSLCEAH